MSFRRGKLDVGVPVLAFIGIILGPLSLQDAIETSYDIPKATPIPGTITQISDRAPYQSEPDRFKLEFPTVEYVDHEGFVRHLSPYSGALPGYFHLGQTVEVGRIDRRYVILDRWYVWQDNLLRAAMSAIFVLYAIGYYSFWRPRMIAKERRIESNQPPQPTTDSSAVSRG